MKAERVTELAKEVEHLSRLGASRLQHGNTEKALEAYRQAYLRSQLLGHNGYMQRACAFNLGSMLISTGNFTEGLNYLKLAKPPEGYRDGKSNGDLYFNSGLAYEGLQNVEETKHCYSKALEEYRWEHNINMEADVLGRLGKAYLMCDQFTEAASCLKQLIHVQEKLGDYTKQLQSQAEQASLLLRMDQVAEAEKIADDCFLRCQGDELSNSIANVLTELSLTYTQMRSYDKALRCCQIALPLVAAKDADAKQIAILYQNLGVINSYLGQYQNAIEYHQKAASKYAELSIRKCQGHCFINMGYAYSQLGDIHRAGEYFLHSLQAAKDCGDRKSEWQSLEALGSVAYHHGNRKQSQEYYRAALTVVAKSPDADDTVVQDRILQKLTSVAQSHKPNDELASFQQQENIQSRTYVEAVDNALVKTRTREGGVIALKKGAKIKYLRVRRSGTLLKFNKVAHGLDPSMSPVPTARQVSLGVDLEEDVFSASTIGISDIDENEELEFVKEVKGAKHTRHSKRVLRSYSRKDREESEENESEEDETRRQVLNAMRNVVSYEDDKAVSLQTEPEGGQLSSRQGLLNRCEMLSEEQSQSGEETQSEPCSQSEEETAGEEEETDNSNSSENTDDDEEEDEDDGSDKKTVPPEIPSMLPDSTISGPLRTYEVPVRGAERTPSAGHDQVLMNVLANTENEDEDKIYESIRLPTLQEHNINDDDFSSGSDEETESELTEHKHLPKGKRDEIEYKAFPADLKGRHVSKAQSDDPVMSKKASRVCILM